MSKTFKYAGASTFDSETKIRFTNAAGYEKVLLDKGHKDVIILRLPEDMTKIEAAQHLIQTEWMKDDAKIQAALQYALTSRVDRAEKVEKATDDPIALMKQIIAQQQVLSDLFTKFNSMNDEE